MKIQNFKVVNIHMTGSKKKIQKLNENTNKNAKNRNTRFENGHGPCDQVKCKYKYKCKKANKNTITIFEKGHGPCDQVKI